MSEKKVSIYRVKYEDTLKSEMTCPSSTYFSEDALRTWSTSFQKVFAAILARLRKWAAKARAAPVPAVT